MRSRNQKNKQVNSTGQIRIIGGKHRSRKLKVLDVQGLRPTTDRVKETIFNWLMPYTNNAVVLDCFAGSGGLGFEALSRYAEQVDFIELDNQAHKQLEENIKVLKAENAVASKGNCLDLLPTFTKEYNLIFVDPPFRKGLALETCLQIEKYNLIAQNGVIYLEVERELGDIEFPLSWQVIKEKSFGQVTSYLLQKISS